MFIESSSSVISVRSTNENTLSGDSKSRSCFLEQVSMEKELIGYKSNQYQPNYISSWTPFQLHNSPVIRSRKPIVTRELPAEVSLIDGDTLTLCFAVDAHPEVEFTWYINNFEVKKSSNVLIETPSKNETRVTFLSPHAGFFKVVARNNFGTATSISRVYITEAPAYEYEKLFSSTMVLSNSIGDALSSCTRDVTSATRKSLFFIKALPQQIYANGNKAVELEVQVAGENPITFVWFINGLVVENTHSEAHTAHLFATNSSRLTIAQRSDDVISIAVEATNIYGSVWSEAQMITVFRVSESLEHGCLVDSSMQSQTEHSQHRFESRQIQNNVTTPPRVERQNQLVMMSTKTPLSSLPPTKFTNRTIPSSHHSKEEYISLLVQFQGKVLNSLVYAIVNKKSCFF